jgi:hypothetical protein
VTDATQAIAKAKRAKKMTLAPRAAEPAMATSIVALRAGNGEAPAPTWEDMVAEGKRLITEADKNNWRLAELSDRVGTIYGEGSLAKFATEIGLAPCTVKRRRSTYRAWKDFLKGDARPRLSYSVARALETHPERERLVKALALTGIDPGCAHENGP